MFTEVINPFLNVRNKIKDKDDNWVDMKKPREVLKTGIKNRVRIEPGEYLEVFNVFDKKIIIDHLVWGTYGSSYPVLMHEDVPYAVSTNLLHLIQRGGGWSSTTPKIINVQGSDMFKVQSYDREHEDGIRGTLYLRKPIILPNGGKLAFTRRTEDTRNEVTFKVIWREIEE